MATAAEATPFPCAQALTWAARKALEEDKPIHLDYYVDTATGKAFLGENKAMNERVLIRDEEEFTSPITGLFKADSDILVITMNSIYIVSSKISKKAIRGGAAE